MTVAVCFPLDFFIVGVFLKVSLIIFLGFSTPGISDGLDIMVRVCLRFQFQIGHSNYDHSSKKALNFFSPKLSAENNVSALKIIAIKR